ncbi:hypothetical protein Tsubulata_022848 [Turnera subulata]|uniref:Beta-glucosidase n=1 Tax=Turnera subulata TaxID=218843 RepID=A0A9Q0FDG0_9ROSI|nr:hypothetical protein Tsubulata_022848 [Turnera subulata]
MATTRSLVLGLLVLVCCLALLTEPATAGFNPSEFPNGFYFGSATSAFQTEGAANKSGRGPSVWDAFVHEYPERILDGQNADVAVDFYNRYKEDLRRMKDTGLNAMRFSISWSRLIPHGQIRAGINQEGVTFYNNLINEALSLGLEPFATIFHWDTPQALEDKYGGFLSPNIVADYRDYANFLFKTFGDRVRHWITLNEPWAYSAWGFDTGEFAPGRTRSTHSSRTFRPLRRFMDPVTFGDYPRNMRVYVGDRLPKFTIEQSNLVRGSLDFLGVNYYSARFAANVDYVDPQRLSYTNDAYRELKFEDSSGNSIGPEAGLSWLRVAPWGIRYLLNYTKDTYRNPEIFITETGVAHDNETATYDEIIHDKIRIDYYDNHLGNISMAMREYGVNIKGFFAWTFMDNFEWSSGFTKRFGMTYIDYNRNLTRIPKDSSKWFSNKLLPKRETQTQTQTENRRSRPLGFQGYSSIFSFAILVCMDAHAIDEEEGMGHRAMAFDGGAELKEGGEANIAGNSLTHDELWNHM